MTIRHYSSLDAGAPALSGTLFAKLRTILRACLVDGYGAQAPAGWTIGHDVVNGVSFYNGDGYINFVYLSAIACTVYIMESITDGSTALAAGVNRRSGPWYEGQSTTDRAGVCLAAADQSLNWHWAVVADSKTVVISIGCGSAIAAANNPSTNASGLYFGKYINSSGLTGASTFIVLGGNANGNVNATFGGMATDYAWYGMSLRNPFTGLIDQGGLPKYAPGTVNYQLGVQVSKTVVNASRLYSVRSGLLCCGAALSSSTLINTAVLGGYLRGIVSEPTLSSTTLEKVLGIFGKAYSFSERVKAITLPDERKWVPFFVSSGYSPGCFISLATADWE